jgi:hypothetical protein
MEAVAVADREWWCWRGGVSENRRRRGWLVAAFAVRRGLKGDAGQCGGLPEGCDGKGAKKD